MDAQYGNSSGYFRDPTNGADLSSSTPRVVPCELKDGKFIWPQVAAADGSMLLKIVYKLFTEEEKNLYKAYRGRSTSSEPRQRSEPKAKVAKVINEEPEYDPREPEEKISVVRFDEDAATTPETFAIIASCDRLIGVSQISGLTYALLTKTDSRTVYHIPRCVISDQEFNRLCT